MNNPNYRVEQIRDALKNYQDICNIFFDLASDDKMRETLEEVLYYGGCNGLVFNTELGNKDNPFLEGKRRISMAYLLIRNPETFYYFVQNKINLFHGTNGNALPPIIKYGLTSFDESEKRGINVTTGESWSREPSGRDFVSLTDILSVACFYSAAKPDSDESLNFGIVFGVSFSDIAHMGRCYVSSDVPEVGIRDKVPAENIKTICVLADKVPFAQKVVKGSNVKVLAMDDMEERFYYIDDFNGIYIYPELLDKLKNDLEERKNKSKITFNFGDFRSMTINRILSGVKSKLESLGLIIREEDERKL